MNAKVEPGDEIAAAFAKSGLPAVTPATTRDRGGGPHRRIVLRKAMVIDGTGAPPWGPADLLLVDGKIVGLAKSGKVDVSEALAAGALEIDCSGKFVTPGFVDCHAHIGAPFHAHNGEMAPADYVYKLWLAHGVTTIRETACFNGLSWTMQQKEAAERNEIAAPRILAYPGFPATTDYARTINTPDQAVAWLEAVKARGASGVKFFGAPPAIKKAALGHARTLDLKTCCHHAQLAVARTNALKSATWGLTSTEHFYGIAEALFETRTIQNYPGDYDYSDEYLRFATAGQTFMQAAEPGSATWERVLDQFLELGHTFVPTFNVYDANRDLMRTRRADWHDRYTDPTLWAYFQPQRGGHGAYFYRWSTTNETEWRETFRRWMRFVNDYKNRGGRVAVGSDSGFMFQTFGFGFVRELELLQEAGFHPLEVLRSATAGGAELVGLADTIGTLEIGKEADILIHQLNPLTDFKLLYGTGAIRLNDATASVEWPRALHRVIKGGVIYDPEELLADVERMVAERRPNA